MTPRARRWVATAITVVVLLYGGRWLAGFAAERWWAGAISPAAEAAVTRWRLLGLALDVGAVCVASCWFALQGLLVARAIGTVQVQRRVGDQLVRELVPTRWLVAGAIAMGVLLGLLTGAGAAAWRAPLLLALNAPRYGLTDPLLGIDLGILVARYPLWHAAHRFILILVLLGIFLALALHGSIGGIKRQAGKVEWHPDSRRHLGGLSAVLAVVLAVGYLLGPYRLATSIDVPLTEAAASTRILASHAAAGAALATAGLSLAWALRARVTLLLSGWLVLMLAAITERFVVPAFVAEAGSAVERAKLQRQMDSVFHQITLVEGTPSDDSIPAVTALWDAAGIEAWARQRGEIVRATAATRLNGDATWLVATTAISSPAPLVVTRLDAARVDGNGRAILADTAHSALEDPRSVPGAAGWATTRGGVRVGRWLRPLALAWAQQAPGILSADASATVDWNRDPRERVAALVPALEWRPLGMTYLDGRLVWVMTGLATVGRAPLATRVAFGGRTVSGVVPSMVAVVVAESGAVTLYPDPSAGPLGLAWQQAFRGVVSPPADLPAAIATTLEYPADWFSVQLTVLAQAHWGVGVPSLPAAGDPLGIPATVWRAGGTAPQQAMEDPEHRFTVQILSGVRTEGRAEIRTDRLPPGVPTAAQLRTAWKQVPVVEQLSDSLRAAGDTLVFGPVRWHHGAAGVVAWQPMVSGGGQGLGPAILWFGAATSHRVAGGRRPAPAWASILAGADHDGAPDSAEESARIEAVRSWMMRGDSALVRGDLTAFARAWEALRGLLLDSTPR